MSCLRRAVSKLIKDNRLLGLLPPSSSPATTKTPLFSGSTALIVAVNSNAVLAKDDEAEQGMGLRKIEDDSVKSNIHTSKWRVFTDEGRKFFLEGKLEEAEKLFVAALKEAKEGFGERDPHVAFASNNLAELYRVYMQYHKAEPLYLEAISILEESLGPEDIRVGSALHNLGQFYIVQRKWMNPVFPRALKIKRRVLGLNHTDYADTMYHLGMVLHVLGKEKESEALIQASIRILEDGGQGESIMRLKRMCYLAQICLKSNQFEEAEKVQRKILYIMKLTKGWNALDTAITAESLALILQSTWNLKEAEELLERCLDTQKALLPQDHIQWQFSDHLKKIDDYPKAIAELDKAKGVLQNSVRIAQSSLDKLMKQSKRIHSHGSCEIGKNSWVSLLILLQASDALGLLEISKKQLEGSKFVTQRSIPESPEIKAEYLKCLKHLLSLNCDSTIERTQQNLQDLRDEIKRLEVEVSLRACAAVGAILGAVICQKIRLL